MATMAKNKPKGARGRTPDPDKVVMYLEVPAWIKEQMNEVASENDRSLTGEAIQAFKEHLAKHGRGPQKGGGE